MYSVVLALHSWLRWITLSLAVAATLNALRSFDGRPNDRPPEGGRHGAPDARTALPGRWWDTVLMLAVDLQVLLGLILYFGLSPFTKQAMENFGAAVHIPALRFWAIEHAGGMFAAVVLVRMGRVLAMNAPRPAAARQRRLICFALATVVMLAAMPWPGLANGRPLIRSVAP